MQQYPSEANCEAVPRNMPETPSYIVSSHLTKAFSTFGGGIEKGKPAWIAYGSRLGSRVRIGEPAFPKPVRFNKHFCFSLSHGHKGSPAPELLPKAEWETNASI